MGKTKQKKQIVDGRSVCRYNMGKPYSFSESWKGESGLCQIMDRKSGENLREWILENPAEIGKEIPRAYPYVKETTAMTLQTYIDQRNMTKYHLSKISGVPKTTILDICAGRSNVERCSAKTVQQLAKALNCSMEDIMALSDEQPETGRLADDSYLECGLPEFLQESIQVMVEAWRKLDGGEEYLRWDCDYCNLQSDINNAEVNLIISTEQAWYLREKYLRMERTGLDDFD